MERRAVLKVSASQTGVMPPDCANRGYCCLTTCLNHPNNKDAASLSLSLSLLIHVGALRFYAEQRAAVVFLVIYRLWIIWGYR